MACPGLGRVKYGLCSKYRPTVSASTSVLLRHPVSPDLPISVSVGVSRLPDGLLLVYRIAGDIAGLAIPEPQLPGPADELWRHTCCEAFVAAAGEAGYREFNFSPSGQWAAYAFSGYRQRADWPVPLAPRIGFSRSAEALVLEALLPLALLPAGDMHLGLTAVTEAADGRLGYWALAHPGENPDFHRREAFSLDIAAWSLL